MAKWFKTIWANTGDKTAVPDATDPSGYVSYEKGYGADYQRVLGTDPLAKSIERDKLNQVLHDMTGAIQQYQINGFPDYIDAATNGGVAYAYPVGSVVRFTDNKNYRNTVAGNTSAPNVSGWVEFKEADASFARQDPVSEAVLFGYGTTAERPLLLSTERAIWYNTDLSSYEGWNGATWGKVGGGQMLGEAQVKAISYNAQTINENITIPANYNYSMVGTVTIGTGYTVTGLTGSRGVVL